MGYKYGEARYSNYRYSWITEWLRQECWGVATASRFTAQDLPMGTTIYGPSNPIPITHQAHDRGAGNQQPLGLRPQLQLRHFGHDGRPPPGAHSEA